MKQELSTVAIDLAKKVFHLVGTDTTGNILWRKRLSRNALMPFIAQLPPVLIGMEACGGAPLLGQALSRARPRSQAHGASVCQSVRQVEQKWLFAMFEGSA